jgi:hypothetical protein
MVVIDNRSADVQINVNHVGLKIKVKFTGQLPLPGESRGRLPPIFGRGKGGLFGHKFRFLSNGDRLRGAGNNKQHDY